MKAIWVGVFLSILSLIFIPYADCSPLIKVILSVFDGLFLFYAGYMLFKLKDEKASLDALRACQKRFNVKN